MPASVESFPASPVGRASQHCWRLIARAKTAIVLVIFVLAYFGLEMGSAPQRSATYDEPIHLMAGYAALARGDYRIDPTHPPFLRMWAALPLLGMENGSLGRSRIDRIGPLAWIAEANFAARDFLFRGRDADRTLNAARFMITILGAALGILVFCWAREWLGFVPAVMALAFYLIEPNLGAHAALVTTDLGVTCFYFGASYFLWRACRRWSTPNVVGAVFCFALACVSKFSAVLLVPVGGLLLAYAVARKLISLPRACGLAGVAGLVAVLAIWTVYGFRYEPSATAGWVFKAREVSLVPKEFPVLMPALDWVDSHNLLPNAFSQGFLLGTSMAENQPSYLAGDISNDGWWYYFPAAFAVKTPVPLLLLAGVGAVVLVRRRARLGVDNGLFLLVPAAVYLGVAMTTAINIGLRHILPIYPFVLLLAAAAAWEVAGAAWRARTKWLVLGGLMGFWLWTYARVYPHTLTFFNQLVGGARNGSDYLVDSNLDWGQHLKQLKEWMDEEGVARINLAYFGMADPAYYGIGCVLLPGTGMVEREKISKPELPGYVAISATIMSGVSFTPAWRLFYAGFRDLEPVAVIGNTINVYRVETWPEESLEADGPPTNDEIEQRWQLGMGLIDLGWNEQALRHFEQYLRYRPNSAKGYAYLGNALFQLNRKAEGVQALRQAVKLEPGQGVFRGALIEVLIDVRQLTEALAQARELVRLQPNNPHAHDMLGFTLGCMDRPAEALVEFERALKMAPGDPLIRRHLELARGLKDPASGTPAGRKR